VSSIEHAAAVAPPAPAETSAPDGSRTGRGFSPGRHGFFILSWLAPLLAVLTWEACADAGLFTPQILPAPSRVAQTAIKLARSGSLFADLGVSLLRAAAGLAIGGFIGFSLGVLVGFSRLADALIDRSVQMIRAIPFLAVLPLVIVWLGVGEAQKIFLV
jgi:sulfonate transport system permease protein